MSLDLTGRTWPVPPWENPEFDLKSSHLRSAVQHHHRGFVQEGTMVAMPLAFPGVTTPIPADECAIVSLGMDSTRMIFGGTAGRRAHLFAAMTRGATGIVHDLGPVPGATACTAVMPAGDRTIYLSTSGPEGGKLFSHPPVPWPYDCLQEWGFSRPGYAELAHPFADEGIAEALLDEPRGMIYGISDRTGTLFGCPIGGGEVRKHGKVDAVHRFSRRIVRDSEGNIWGTACNGSLWRFNPSDETLVDLDVWIPCAAGREIHNRAEAFALDPATGIIYGSGSADGFLFAFDPRTETVRSLGKPGVSPTIRALTVGNDGRLFGIVGGDDDIGHLFAYDPETHSLRDLGVPISLFGVRAYGYVYTAALTGADGEIFFGQAERVSHLWLYFPAIPRRSGNEPPAMR
jgi:streptogramin lyase